MCPVTWLINGADPRSNAKACVLPLCPLPPAPQLHYHLPLYLNLITSKTGWGRHVYPRQYFCVEVACYWLYNTLHASGDWSTTGSARGLVVEAAALFCSSGAFAMSHSRAVGVGPLEMKRPAVLRGRPGDPDTSTRALQPVDEKISL